MKKVGICVIIHFFACSIVFAVKTIHDIKTAFGRYHSDHLITEPTQTSHTLFNQLYPEPLAVLYGIDGKSIRRIGGNIYAKILQPSIIAYESTGNGPKRE
jgi:hypothetical protein